MATKDQKNQSLESAIEVAKAFAQSGNDKFTPAEVLSETYDMIVKITDQFSAKQKQG